MSHIVNGKVVDFLPPGVMPDPVKYPPKPPPVASGMTPEERDSLDLTIKRVGEIHAWLSEIMPAARVAIKMMDARTNLMRRWRGGKSVE